MTRRSGGSSNSRSSEQDASTSRDRLRPISYTYDAAGRRTGMTVAGQPTVTYGYDSTDRLTSITQGSTIVSFSYDIAGRRTSLTLPNNVMTEYAYDAASRLTGLTYKHGTTTLGTLTYTHDANSQRRQIGGTWARTGLPQAVTAATYNAANHQLTFGGQALTYDLNGNLTTDGANTYTWNARDQLAGTTGTSTASFGYDALGRRRQKTISGATTSFLYDGFNAIQEATGTGVTNLLDALSLDEVLVRTDGAGSQSLFRDGLGSTLALTDTGGEVATEYTYEPFGTTTTTGAGSANASQYTGRENDGTAMYFYRARYYHPGLQRFISEDPIRFLGGTNFYTYAANNPIGGRDPLGLCNDPEPGGPGLRYCMNRYIPDPTSLIFEGDNRGTNPNGGSFKSEQMLSGNGAFWCTPGISRIVNTPIKNPGSVGKCDAKIVGRKDGHRTIHMNTTARHGLLPFAPPIQTELTIHEGPSGEAAVTVSGTLYPSMEVWQYGGPGGPRLIYHHTALDTPAVLYLPGPLPWWSSATPP